jgi:hypothetical protein
MNYQLHREGRNVEVLSLAELRRRREAGELDGQELVWREGMTNWQWLDTVLERDAGNLPRTTPPPIPNSAGGNRSRIIAVVVSIVVVLGIAEVIWLSTGAVKIYRSFRASAALGDSEDAVAVARQPIAAGTNTRTQLEANQRGRDFRIRQYLDGYEQRGDRDPQVDAQVRELIRTWIAHHFGGQEATNSITPQALSERLAANPRCNDPLVLTVISANDIGTSQKRRLLERALSGYDVSKHRAYPRFYATVSLAGYLDRGSSHFEDLEQSALRLLKQGFADGSFIPVDQPEIAEFLINTWGNAFFKRSADAICRIVEDAGRDYEWLALVLEGEHHISEAWKARGGGYANTVSSDGWQRFHRHLGSAREALTKAWEKQPELPIAPCRMIYVSLGDSDLEEMRRWFDHTVAAQIDYNEAWANLRWGMRPRWYGSHEAIRELGVTAIKTGRFDTDVPRKFFDSVTDIESELELAAGEHIYGQEDIWPWMQQMYEGYIAHHAGTPAADGWRSAFTVVAYLGGKHDVSRTQLEALNWQPRPENLSNWGRDLSLLPEEVAARTGPLNAEIDVAEAHRNNGNILEALRAYQRLAFTKEEDQRTRRFIQCRVAALEIEQRLAKGEWVEFLPSGAADPNWVFALGHAERQAGGSMEVSTTAKGHMLYSRARVGSEFEMKGEFEVLRSSTGAFQAGIVFGHPNPDDIQWNSIRIRQTYEGAQVASFSPGWTTRHVQRNASLNKGVNEFQLRFQDGRARVLINGSEVIRRGRLPVAPRVQPGEFLLGLGGASDGETVIRYSRVQVRRVIGENAPASAGAEPDQAE